MAKVALRLKWLEAVMESIEEDWLFHLFSKSFSK